jgi:hypothetical protein
VLLFPEFWNLLTQQDRSREREIRSQTSPAIIIIIARTTINHPSKQRNGAYVKIRRILEVKSMRIDSNLQIYIGGPRWTAY